MTVGVLKKSNTDSRGLSAWPFGTAVLYNHGHPDAAGSAMQNASIVLWALSAPNPHPCESVCYYR